MMISLWSAATGMQAQELNMDVIANNLSNVDTLGFKKSRVEFQDLLYQNQTLPGSPNADGGIKPSGIQIGNGVRPIATQRIMTQGETMYTGNQLDMAIQGEGYFQVLMPDGSIGYTRNGAIKSNQNGQLVTSEGYYLEPAITIPTDTTNISISSDGTVSVMAGASTEQQNIGRIEIARFANPAGLMSIGQNLLKQTVASGAPETGAPSTNGLGPLVGGVLETSNVKAVEEMVKMIMAQRAYEVNTKSIQTADSMLQMANNIKR